MTGSGAEPGRVPEEELLARAAWSRLVEPGDVVAGALVAELGAVDALAWVREMVTRGAGVTPGGTAALPSERRLTAAVARWAPRVAALDPARDVDAVLRLGGALLVPGAPGWPRVLEDLGAAVPHALWVLGRPELDRLTRGAVAVIGARACTGYGEHVTAEISTGIADSGRTVVSGGAYGIDAVAHRAVLARSRPTVAVLAGGVDRLYPSGNARLLRAAAQDGGALVSEVPPGGVPSRSRFLQRNRLIAALAAGTVVVEAAWRSGALSTAAHAAALLRPVGAVPGPVTSAASAGCHRLLRDGAAVCVTDAAEVLELVGSPEQVCGDKGVAGGGVRPEDLPDPTHRRVLDALPVRAPAPVASLARVAGLSPGEVRAALGVLELAGLAVGDTDGWRRAARQTGHR